MSQYVGLAALKEAIGLSGAASDTVDDGLLASLIARSSALVDNRLDMIRPGWVGISAGSNSRSSVGSNTRLYDGTGDDTLWIDDASSISQVTVSGVLIDPTTYSIWPYNESPKRAIIYNLPTPQRYGILSNHWTIATANVAVTGYWGLDSVPDDIAQVTLALCILLWRRYQSGEEAPLVSRINTGQDPEIDGILAGLDGRWWTPVVKGA